MSEDTQSTVASAGPAAPEAKSACIVVIHGEGLGKRVDVGRRDVVIGRSPDVDLRIPHPSVSRRHCTLGFVNGRYLLRDLGATNCTRLNERPITEAELHDGDHITTGESILKFISHASVEARYHEEVYLLATHDALTGLFNRRGFEEMFDREVARAEQSHHPLTLAILDIDLFKQINDVHGHAMGDAVLQQLGAVIGRDTHAPCIAARIGGEEFAMLLPELSAEDVSGVAETIRADIEATSFVAGTMTLRVTISIGTAQFGTHRSSRSALLKAADEALYRAKSAGRNRVCVADD